MILIYVIICHLCLGHRLQPLRLSHASIGLYIFLGWPCAVLMDNFGMIPEKFGWLWDPNGTGQSGSLHFVLHVQEQPHKGLRAATKLPRACSGTLVCITRRLMDALHGGTLGSHQEEQVLPGALRFPCIQLRDHFNVYLVKSNFQFW